MPPVLPSLIWTNPKSQPKEQRFVVPDASTYSSSFLLTEKKEEEITENFESFIKQHEELIEPGQAERTIPSQPTVDKKEMVTEEEEEPFLFSEKAEAKKEPLVFPAEFGEAERAEVKPPKPKRMARREKRGPSMIFALIVILILLVFGVFYLWTELESKGKLATLFRISHEEGHCLMGSDFGG